MGRGISSRTTCAQPAQRTDPSSYLAVQPIYVIFQVPVAAVVLVPVPASVAVVVGCTGASAEPGSVVLRVYSLQCSSFR